MAALIFIIIINSTFFYSTFYLYSLIIYFDPASNSLLWRLSVISGFLSLVLVALLYSFIFEYKQVPILPFLFFITLFGIIIGLTHWEDSAKYYIFIEAKENELITDIDQVTIICSIQFAIIITVLQLAILVYMFITAFRIYSWSKRKDISVVLIINTLIFAPSIILYILYLYIPLPILRDLHLIILWVCLMGVCFMIKKNPETFLLLTNKISYLNIYHKSGVELYSYKFEKSQNNTDSQIWGNILIGLNHILSEFIDKADQIDVLQTKNADIIVNYDELGFAVMVMTNQKNIILEKMMKDFTSQFKRRFMLELTEIYDLNRLINVSDFEETKEIIEDIFEMYL